MLGGFRATENYARIGQENKVFFEIVALGLEEASTSVVQISLLIIGDGCRGESS